MQSNVPACKLVVIAEKLPEVARLLWVNFHGSLFRLFLSCSRSGVCHNQTPPDSALHNSMLVVILRRERSAKSVNYFMATPLASVYS
jgi:hypothetical protein